MIRFICFFTGLLLLACPAFSATRASNYVSANTYNNMYPYMNNTMRTNLNPGVSPSQTNSQINVLTKTISTPQTTTRRVVPRSATSTSRSAVSSGSTMSARSATTGTARSATTSATARSAMPTAYNTTNTSNSQTTRRVVARSASTARSATSGNTTARSATNNARASVTTNNVTTANRTTTGRTQNTYTYMNTNNTSSTNVSLSSSRCLADYIDCMNGYCERENTAYNRCYCSAQLSQIDSTYQPEIDRLIKEILKKQNQGGKWTDEEMNDYWMSVIGQYTGGNSWSNLEDALDINWADTESRVRGQQAFATGHEYCVQHLRGCYYMAANLRDAYRSEIARDCAAYESSLQRLKNAAESILESYK